MSRNPIRRHGLVLLSLLLPVFPLAAEEKDLRELLRDALYTEEVTRDPEAAAKQYEALLSRHDAQRAFAASALFRLAEVRRKQDRKEEAIALYQRLIREFPDSAPEGKLARENLAVLGAKEIPGAKDVPVDRQTEEIRNLQKQAETMPDIIKRPEYLDRAITNDDARVVEFLIGLGTDLNSHGYLPGAVNRGNLGMCRLLLDRGADPNAPVNASSLSEACRFGFEEVVRLLLSRRANPNLEIQGVSDGPLREAIMGGHPVIVRLLLEHGATPNHPLETPATQFPSEPVLQPGMPKNQLSSFGGPIHLATARTDLGILKLLLEKGADPGIADTRTGLTALHLATNPAWNGNRGAIPLLLKAGAKPVAETKSFQDGKEGARSRKFEAGVTPLRLALQNQLLPEARLMIEAGADPKRPGLLVAAVQGANVEAIQLLLEKGADPNGKKDEFPAIHHAIRSGNPEVLRALLEAGADPNSSSPDKAALAYASARQDGWPMIELLLEKGAKPEESWKKSLFGGADPQIRLQLIHRILFPEVAARKSITAFNGIYLHSQSAHVFHEMITKGSDERPPLLHELILDSVKEIQGKEVFHLGEYIDWPTEVLLTRIAADGTRQQQKVDLIHDGQFPELAWGDILEFKTIARDGGETPPESPLWPLRKRVSFPVTVEIDGKSRVIQLRGDRLMFDPTKAEAPWVGAGRLMKLLWQPGIPPQDASGIEIIIARKGWQDIRMPFDEAGSDKFPLERGDVVKLAYPDGTEAHEDGWRRVHVTLLAPGIPFVRHFGIPRAGTSDPHDADVVPATLPTLFQAITHAMVSPQIPAGAPSTPAEIPSWLLQVVPNDPPVLLPHPDFAKICLRRLRENGSEEIREIDLASVIAASSDATTAEDARKADVELLAGDIVELPLRTDRAGEPWKGLSAKEATFFAKALNCRVQFTDYEGKVSLREARFMTQHHVETEFGWFPLRRDGADPAGAPAMTAQQALQIFAAVTEVTRSGTKHSNLNLDPASLFLRDGDLIRSSGGFSSPAPRPGPARQPRPRVVPPPSR